MWSAPAQAGAVLPYRVLHEFCKGKKILRPFCAPPRSGAGDPLSGPTFLVVDGNGAPGYTAGADYVIDITGYGGNASQIHFV